MSNLSQIIDLGKTALDAVISLFYLHFTRTLDPRFVNFSLDVQNSELIITSRDESSSGEVGIYRGEYRWPYAKANLSLVCPHPLVVQAEYPMTFRQLRSQLLTRYQIVLEEGEFSLTNGGAGLMDDDNIATPLINQYGQFYLYATAQSGRFQAGSRMTLIFIQPGRRVPLRGLFDLKAPNVLGELAAA